MKRPAWIAFRVVVALAASQVCYGKTVVRIGPKYDELNVWHMAGGSQSH